MPLEYLRCICALPMDGGIPEDTVTNTMHFVNVGTDAAAAAAELDPVVLDFYRDIDGELFANSIANLLVTTWYDMSDPTPRIPVYSGGGSLTASANGPLPAEVAMCLSFQGVPVSGTPQARRRGRIYIGPIADDVPAYIGPYSRPATASIDVLRVAASDFMAAVLAVGGNWCVYSPTSDATETLADSFTYVTNGWVDNAWDTQRRRGVAATVRGAWS